MGKPSFFCTAGPTIHSYVDVAPLLASQGYRVIVPYLRGYGSTRFLSSETFRNGQQSVVALDVIALMDALKIQKAIVGGFDRDRVRPTLWRRSTLTGARLWSRSAVI
jgi:pimeloyl-ACP methyl ester carboxylesterase